MKYWLEDTLRGNPRLIKGKVVGFSYKDLGDFTDRFRYLIYTEKGMFILGIVQDTGHITDCVLYPLDNVGEIDYMKIGDFGSIEFLVDDTQEAFTFKAQSDTDKYSCYAFEIYVSGEFISNKLYLEKLV